MHGIIMPDWIHNVSSNKVVKGVVFFEITNNSRSGVHVTVLQKPSKDQIWKTQQKKNHITGPTSPDTHTNTASMQLHSSVLAQQLY